MKYKRIYNELNELKNRTTEKAATQRTEDLEAEKDELARRFVDFLEVNERAEFLYCIQNLLDENRITAYELQKHNEAVADKSEIEEHQRRFLLEYAVENAKYPTPTTYEGVWQELEFMFKRYTGIKPV